MPLSHADRIARDARHPRIVDLWFALQPLKTVVSFMQSGAHPDDETSGMLAALAFRDGIAVSYACAVRGEGGQNDIGTETTEDLGTLRTAEMERAAEVLDLNLYWLSESPEDSIFDFGLSKSGVETMGRWGPERVLRRFVQIVRAERPDILCPTFLDIPGQHGHHRAMTLAAHRVFDAAADPDFPGVDLPAWQISKLYLPAWSGAGGAYDDEVPPPPATLGVPVRGADPVTGWSWERIGQQSRAHHRTQGMGRWVPEEQERDRPLHLARSTLPGPDGSVTDGLAVTLADFADRAGPAGPALRAAQTAMDAARAAFPDNAGILHSAIAALGHVHAARAECADALRNSLDHRLARKAAQLGRVIRLAAEVEVIGHVGDGWLRPGQVTPLGVECRDGRADRVEVTPALPDGWVASADGIGPGPEAPPSDPYPPIFSPLAPAAPALDVAVTVGDVVSTTRVALLQPPVVLPACSLAMTPEKAVLNTAGTGRAVELATGDIWPEKAELAVAVPTGWQVARAGAGFSIQAPAKLEDGLYELAVTLGGAPAMLVRRMAHRHIAPRARATPAVLKIRAVDAVLPERRVGYIGGGSDRVGHWLRAMGVDVTDIADAGLGDPAHLAGFDSIVIGIFAMRFRAGLMAAMPALHDWTAAGGTLLTLYHRPWDNWDPDRVPPRRLEIGQPSLRWRVTDETAEVRHLVPDHPLLTTPNAIGPQDWEGWHKERGLYFAKSWDPAYVPLLELADPDEEPHRGALLSAGIGAGRHTHCALILHHQMEKLTPGAFRLMANLIA